MRQAEELRYLILAAQRDGNRLLTQALKPLGLTPSQAEVLRVLQDRQPLTLSGLGDLLICESGSSPSRLVDRMAAAGYIDRQSHPHDRRRIELSLTDLGATLVRRVVEIEDNLYAAIDALTADTDITQLTAFLRAFVTGLPAGEALAKRAQPPSGPSQDG